MIQNVRSGQTLTAGLLNNIISQANGQDIPSNQNFVNTDKGTLFVNNHDYEVGGSEGSFNKFLECWIDNAPEISNRPNEYVKDGDGNLIMKPYILVNLGNSKENACKNITVNNKPVDGIVLISNKENLDDVVTDETLKNNYFVQLAEIDGSSKNVYDVHFILYKAIKKSDKKDEPPEILGYIFVISKEDVESAEDRAKNKIKEIEGFDEVTHLQIINEKKILSTTKLGNNSVITQNIICSQDLIDNENILSSDTDVSNEDDELNQYSVEIKSTIIEKEDDNGEPMPTEVKYLGLYNFNSTSADLSIVIDDKNKSLPKYYNILVRENDLAGGATLKYATLSIDLSGGNSVSVITDTELTSTGLQSIDKKYSEDISTDYLTLYNFDKTEKDLTLSVSKSNPNLPENYQILVKDTDNEGLITLKYADLSVDYSRTLSTDTEVKHLIAPKNTQRSINVVHSKELSGDYLELYNFANGSNVPYTFLPNKLGYEENAYGTKHTFVCRQTDEYGTNPEVTYMDAKVVYPEGDNSSITYNKNDDDEYKYELYQWNDHTVQDIPVLIDVNNVTREPETLPSIAPCQFLAKDLDGKLSYIDLKLDVKRRVEADSELDDISKTIQLKYQDDIPYFCLYGLDKTPVEKTVVLEENEEVNTGIRYVALNGNEIEIQELKIKLPECSGGDNTGDIYNISSNVIKLSDDIEDIEEQLSNFWVLGADANKCYGSSIGNSSQNEVISLDGQILAGDWQVMGSMVITSDVICNGLTASSYIGCTGDIMCNGLTASNYIGCDGDVMCNGLTASNYVGCTGDMQCDGLYCNNLTCTTVVCDSLTIDGTTINGEQLARLLALIN